MAQRTFNSTSRDVTKTRVCNEHAQGHATFDPHLCIISNMCVYVYIYIYIYTCIPEISFAWVSHASTLFAIGVAKLSSDRAETSTARWSAVLGSSACWPDCRPRNRETSRSTWRHGVRGKVTVRPLLFKGPDRFHGNVDQ